MGNYINTKADFATPSSPNKYREHIHDQMVVIDENSMLKKYSNLVPILMNDAAAN